MKSLLTILITGGAMLLATGAGAQVVGVTTNTIGTATIGSGFSISPPMTYTGDQIEQEFGGFDTGTGVKIGATSEVTSQLVAFQNGSGTSGRYTYLTTETDVDITYVNNTHFAQTPILNSEIIAEGLGMYVAGECLTEGMPCGELQSPPSPYTFQSFSQFPQDGAPSDNNIAGSSVEFQILNNGQSLYDLTASTDLVNDPASNTNVFVDNIAQAQTSLNGFQLETPPGSQTAHGFNWQTTDLTLVIPTLLQPGESATLTYRTVTSTYSRADCVDFTACLINYSAFGDPIGRQGGVNPNLQTPFALAQQSTNGIPDITFPTYYFAAPTFRDGILTYVLANVPEPDAWSLMLVGVGLAGLSVRRRRARASLAV
jgi:hypothetical protein